MKTKIIGKVLTARRGRPRIQAQMGNVAEIIFTAIGEESTVGVAERWGVPRWVLDDLKRNRTRVPSTRYLLRIVQGLEQDGHARESGQLEAAILGNGEAKRPANGERRGGKPIASISSGKDLATKRS